MAVNRIVFLIIFNVVINSNPAISNEYNAFSFAFIKLNRNDAVDSLKKIEAGKRVVWAKIYKRNIRTEMIGSDLKFEIPPKKITENKYILSGEGQYHMKTITIVTYNIQGEKEDVKFILEHSEIYMENLIDNDTMIPTKDEMVPILFENNNLDCVMTFYKNFYGFQIIKTAQNRLAIK